VVSSPACYEKRRGQVRISKLLSAKGSQVATITPDASIALAVARLRSYGIGALVVSSDEKHIEGIVSERDVVRALADKPEGLLADPVSSIMSSTVTTCSPEDDIESLMSTMTERRIRHVPIVVDGELHGIVSIGDVVKNRIDELEKDRDELVDYINAR
jgi:CBS domain-containing protein